MMAFNVGLATWACYIYANYDGSCNAKMHHVFLAVGIIFALDAVFVGCNYFYVQRVYKHALEAIESSQQCFLVSFSCLFFRFLLLASLASTIP
jgi:hypothetical protein